jgi:hypothetical protein
MCDNDECGSCPICIIEKKCNQTIKDLLTIYKNDEYILQRIEKHIVNHIPATLANELKEHEKRVNRNIHLNKEQQIFIQVFLNKHSYFYLPNNGYFYEYNGKNYSIITDDDIIHCLLSSISKDRKLLEWKYKTKTNILKLIKNRNLFDSVPNTETIQNVLNVLHPSIFNTKSEAKYFLTVLGDNILKKKTNLIFLMSPKSKKLFAEIDNIACSLIGQTNTLHNFMTKYHENHQFELCRLIKTNEKTSFDLWYDIIKKYGLDLLCVATHYSNRFENSDNFLETNVDIEVYNYSLYLKNSTQQEIITRFCNKCLLVSNNSENNNSPKILWKNLHFVWKQFLSEYSLPNMIYSNNLKIALTNVYSYNESTDSFSGIVSKYLPVESDFIQFWDKTIQITSKYDNIHFVNELEIDELCMLFKRWVKINVNTDNQVFLSNGNINDDYVMKILTHFFPNIEIVEDKYILNVSCSLWNKTKDIHDSLEYIKSQIKSQSLDTSQTNDNSQPDIISIEDAYKHYSNYSKSLKKFVVSKNFFEKYLNYKIPQFIVYEKFIDVKSLL